MLSTLRILIFAACCIMFYYGMQKRAIDKSGFFSSVIMGALLLTLLPLVMWFSLMVAFFVVGSVASKFKRSIKYKKGIAERARGRGVWNVIGNGGVGLAAAILFFLTQNNIFLFGYACSIASACADTIATELGQLGGRKPILLSTLKPVKTGTTGAISFFGEMVALCGAFGIALIPFIYFGFLGIWNFNLLAIITIAGFLGCQIDSVIGAFLEYPSLRRRGMKLFNNHSTNFISTLSAALIGMALFTLL